MVTHLPDRVGQVLLGKLKVLRLIGSGGMGAVYEVEHLITGHRRALKVLHAEVSASAESVRRLVREAGIAGKLQSPYLAETYDVGVLDDGSTYLLMELLDGRPLDAVLASEGRLSPRRAAAIARNLALGLAEAHDAGIVHRDIKPSNVFLARGPGGEEQVRILDFGIAKFLTALTGSFGPLTSDGSILGSPYYMSPEQAAGEADIDARADIYAIGVLLYEMLGGRRPFDGPTPAALIFAIHEGTYSGLDTVVPGLPPQLVAVAHRAMSRDRTARHGSARELAAALERFVEPEPVSPIPPDPGPAPAPPKNAPSKLLLGVVLGAVVLGLAGAAVGGYAVWRLSRTAPAPAVPDDRVVASIDAGTGIGAMVPTADPWVPTTPPSADPLAGWLPPGFDPALLEEGARPGSGPPAPFPMGTEEEELTPAEQAELDVIEELPPRECLARAEGMRQTLPVMTIRFSCAFLSGDREAIRRTCTDLPRRSPYFATPCAGILGSMGGGAGPVPSPPLQP